jgi:eukaryotic-like serine/threonine-protein kinase
VSRDVPTQPMPAQPSTLADGRYRVGPRLGVGGMGMVLQATDEVLSREVAVKLLADNLAADPDARERFEREARAAAKISDPHVVQVFDVGEEQGRPYLVMELVEGPSLADVLADEGPLEPLEVVDVAADALAGVSRAHRAGLLHRDLKPGNLLRAPDGTVKVADFGVAEAADAPGLTRTGLVIGTRSYLAPERAAGQPATVRTDLFALGATLLELLTGRPPAGDDPLAGLRDLHVPGPLTHLLDRMLSTDPQQRPASAEAALALLAGEVPSTADPVGDPTRVLAPTAPEEGPPAPPVGAGGAFPAAATGTATTADLGDRDDADDTAGGVAPESPTSGGPGGVTITWQQLAVVSLLLLLVAVGFQVLGGGDDDPAVDSPAGVERETDPADTARNLGEWLRDRAGQP